MADCTLASTHGTVPQETMTGRVRDRLPLLEAVIDVNQGATSAGTARSTSDGRRHRTQLPAALKAAWLT